MKATIEARSEAIDVFIKVTEDDKSYGNICDYGLKVLKEFYSKKYNKLPEDVLSASVMLFDILNYGALIEDIEEQFGNGVAQTVFNITDREDDFKLDGYEKLFMTYDYIFIKLIIRIARIFNAITNLDGDKFKSYIDDYNELRRKLLSHPNIMVLMDYESDLIKYGRNIFAGKPANSYKYENLILDA